MKQKAWKRLLSFIMTFAMILGICTWDIGGDAIKAEASEAETSETGDEETAVTLSNPRKDEAGNVTYDCVWFGSYPQSDATGEKKDAIKWRVLSVDGNDAFLIADCNLDCQTYNTTYERVTWETSTIRSWLNGYNAGYNANGIDYSSDNFIDKAFTSAEKEAINQVTVVNNDNPEYGTEGGNDTKDKVFLLSIEEVLNPDYGFSSVSYEYDNARWRTNTAYAKEQGAWTYSNTNEDYVKYNGNGVWWLRSPGVGTNDAMGINANNAVSVGSDGYIDYMGYAVDYNNYAVVCPALHLNLSSANIWSYAGTVCTDGNVDERKPVVPDDTEPDEPVTPEPDKPVTPEPDKPVTPEPDKTETPEPDKPATKIPAKKGTTLTVSKNNIKVKVTSTGTSNPTVAVTKISNSSAKKVTIPASVTVDGVAYKVTKIADNAFKGNKKLTTVTIGSNVTSIGKNAFSGCTSLTKATIGKNVTSIGSKAFYKCTKLKSITIPSKVKTIGSSAFYGCTSLTKATIGKNVTSIGDKAFYKCKKLKSITIPSKVKTIGSSAFYGCTSLTKVTMGKSVTSIGSKAFCKCTKLASITIPAKVKSIGSNAFYGCKKLKNITIKSSKLKTIGKNAFKGINKKATVTLKCTKKTKASLKKKMKKSSVGYVKTWKIK